MPAGRFVEGLVAAARRGAKVTLHVAGTMPQDSERENDLRHMERELRDAGVRVIEKKSAPILHLKAVVVDGREAFLADRNFAFDETVVRTDEVRAVEAAIAGKAAHSNDILFGTKGSVQALEAQLVRAAPPGADVIAVSERLDFAPVVRVLLARAGELREHVVVGAHTTTSLAETEALAALAAKGVDVRFAPTNEKGLCVGETAIVTSANDTAGQPSMFEWAARFDGATADALRAHFLHACDGGMARKRERVLE